MITDTSATKPDDWFEDEPELIPDPEAEKPEEWDVSTFDTDVLGLRVLAILTSFRRTKKTVTGLRL